MAFNGLRCLFISWEEVILDTTAQIKLMALFALKDQLGRKPYEKKNRQGQTPRTAHLYQKESFIEYAYRWRKAASRLKTPLTEEDLITSFLRTLKKRTRITGWPDPIGLFYSGKKGNKN